MRENDFLKIEGWKPDSGPDSYLPTLQLNQAEYLKFQPTLHYVHLDFEKQTDQKLTDFLLMIHSCTMLFAVLSTVQAQFKGTISAIRKKFQVT